MSRHNKDWTDRQVLEVLDLMQRQGLTAREIGARFNPSRSAILGVVHRIEKDLSAVPDLATRPENQDGSMPARWWDCPAQRRQR